MSELLWQVNASTDDASEINRGTVYLADPQIVLGTGGTYHYGAFRFTTPVAGYPAVLSDLVGATIQSAHIDYRAQVGDASTGFTIEWIIQDSATPTTFANTAANRISGTNRTWVNWTAEATGKGTGTGSVDQTAAQFGTWVAGTFYQSVDITTLIQQWMAKGHAATADAIVIACHAWTGGNKAYRRPTSYNGAAGNAAYYPRLHINYTTSGGVSVAMPTPQRIYTVPQIPTQIPGGYQREMAAPPTMALVGQTPTVKAAISVDAPAPTAIAIVGQTPTAKGRARVVMQAPPYLRLEPRIPAVTVAAATTLRVNMADPPVVALVGYAPTMIAGGVSRAMAAPPIVALTGRAATAKGDARATAPQPTAVAVSALGPWVSVGGITVAAPTAVIVLGALTPTVSGTSGTDYFTQFGKIQRVIDATKIPVGANVYFEAVIRAATAGKTARARLLANGSIVDNSEVAVETTTPRRVRSLPLVLPSGTYTVEFGGTSGDYYYCYAADVIIKGS